MIYFDTSAFLKTVIEEAESAALTAYLRGWGEPRLVSSALLVVEARRGALRHGASRLPRVDLALDRVERLELSHSVLEAASRLPDPLLRSLDAIHLATALLIRTDVEVLLSYDQRLLEAAAAHRIPTAAPA